MLLPAKVSASLLVPALFLLSLDAQCDQADWELQIEEADISVYTRPINYSPYHEVKAIARIDAPMVRVAKLMGDGNGCAEWRILCAFSEVIETVSEQERVVYLVLDLPWPAKDRDMVVHSKTTIDAASRSATVALQSASAKYPLSDYIRAEAVGQFLIQARAPEQVELTLIMHTDLGGDLPAGAVNSRLAAGTRDDLRRLITLAEP
ncbi:MAG: hypothetical protein HRT77_08645 [Halioglobus sp.]|nr:hypothetical protein [Halioglobus sp.]